MFEALTEKRLVSAKNISKGVLDRDSQLVLVRAPRGNYFQSIGRSVKGTLTLYLEEACFLMNVGQLQIEDYEGISISFRDLYVAVLNSADGWCSFERYQVHISFTIESKVLLSTKYATGNYRRMPILKDWGIMLYEATPSSRPHTL
jgi:tRNA-splicing endonuclease subunit sen54 N-term